MPQINEMSWIWPMAITLVSLLFFLIKLNFKVYYSIKKNIFIKMFFLSLVK